MTSDEFTTLIIGIAAGFMLALAIYVFTPAHGIVEYHGDHPGIETLILEMRDDCESTEGVVSCEWDETKLDFVPAD